VAEVVVDIDLVRALLREQHPDLADLPMEPVASGWDNVMVRLGDDLAVRLPRRALAAALVEHEQRWLPQLAPELPVPVPVPLRVGRPAHGYPWSWSVVPWMPGHMAAGRELRSPVPVAEQLGAFVHAMHRPAPPDAPRNEWRGLPLQARVERFEEHVAEVGDHVDATWARRAWADALAAPAWSGPPVWLHGDLHPANILIDEPAGDRNRITGIVDFGDLTAGDPATDLAVAWMLLPSPARPVFRDAAGHDDATWARGRGWALCLALAFLSGSSDDPVIAGIARRTLAELRAESGGTHRDDTPA
jgi:aminoglycoside phosphotransferase (APT) family kinase protein